MRPRPPMPSVMLNTHDIRRRQRILEAAIVQLGEHGLSPNLLEEAARSAGCSLVQAKVFFGRDEELVLGLYARDRWSLLPLVAIGIFLGAAYSVTPLRLKGRGLAQLFCLWLIIFVGPMWLVSLLLDNQPSAQLLVFAAAYGALQMGVILVNTAEDYPEDLEAKINTTIVSLGLHHGIELALWLTLAGALGSIGAAAIIFRQRAVHGLWWLLLLPATIATLYVMTDVLRLRQSISGVDLQTSIKTVKQAAKKVPLWLTLVAWSMAVAAWAVFMSSA